MTPRTISARRAAAALLAAAGMVAVTAPMGARSAIAQAPSSLDGSRPVGVETEGRGRNSLAHTPQATTLRLLAYNIHHGAGNDEVLDLQRIAELIRSLQPDLVALQEIDNGTERTERVNQAAELGRLTGMGSVFGPFMDYQGGQYGMALLSELDFVNPTNHQLPDGPEPRTALALHVPLAGGEELTFVGIHFYGDPGQRMSQARRLLRVLEEEDEETPAILAGDFNSTPDSEVMALIGETFTIPDKGEDHLTFRSDRPDREIDFIVYRPADRFRVIESRVIDEPVASDHRPVLLMLEVR